MCLFIWEFSIRGPILQDVSTANNEAHLYTFRLITSNFAQKYNAQVKTFLAKF